MHEHLKGDGEETWDCNFSALQDCGWFDGPPTSAQKKGTQMLLKASLRDWTTLGASPAALREAMAAATDEVAQEEAGQEEHVDAPRAKRGP